MLLTWHIVQMPEPWTWTACPCSVLTIKCMRIHIANTIKSNATTTIWHVNFSCRTWWFCECLWKINDIKSGLVSVSAFVGQCFFFVCEKPSLSMKIIQFVSFVHGIAHAKYYQLVLQCRLCCSSLPRTVGLASWRLTIHHFFRVRPNMLRHCNA